MLDFAKRYLELGLHPIPIETHGKKPLIEWKEYQSEAPTIEAVNEWWTDLYPTSNVGIVLGRGIFALDFDGGDRAELELEKMGIKLPQDAPRSQTGNGFHVLLAHDGELPDGVDILKTGERGFQLDIRGKGYIVAPPSIHANGKTYTWIIPPKKIPQAPQKIIDLIKPKEKQTGHWVVESLSGVTEGQRDATCAKLAGYFLKKGIDSETLSLLLFQSFGKSCKPQFTQAQIKKVVDSISRYHGITQSEPRSIIPKHIADLSHELNDLLYEKTKIEGIASTGIVSLDKMLSGGIWPGELVYLGAWAGSGKTALALQIAQNTAKKMPTLIVSKEMGSIPLLRRIVSQKTKVNSSKIRTIKIDDQEKNKIFESLTELSKLSLWMTDEIVSIEEILQIMAEHKPTPKFLVVDYLQLLKTTSNPGERRMQIDSMSHDLKSIALQYKIPVLCLSSMSRPADKSLGTPTMNMLRESGGLEHDADIIILLGREKGKTETQCIVAKNREGYTGDIPLIFLPEILKFEDIVMENSWKDVRAKAAGE